MLKCEGGCQRMVKEYYEMPDLKIFCYDCWRYGREQVQRQEQVNQNRHSQYINIRNQFDFQRKNLQRKLDIEKENAERAHWNSIPYDFTEIRSLEKQIQDLWDASMPSGYLPKPYEIQSLRFRQEYFNNAVFIPEHQTTLYESTRSAKLREYARKKKEEYQKAEAERKRKEEEARDAERKRIEALRAEEERQRIQRKKEAMMKLEQSAEIEAVWLEFDIVKDDEKGLNIHVKFNIYNMLGLVGQVAAYFYTKPSFFRSAKPLEDKNNFYHTQDGHVACYSSFIPSYQNSTYNDYVLYMPYSELHQTKGTHNLMFHIEIFSYDDSLLEDYWYRDGFVLINK